MKVTLRYEYPSPSHCDVRVFVNGGCAGALVLRQEELPDFQRILQRGVSLSKDVFACEGNARWEEQE